MKLQFVVVFEQTPNNYGAYLPDLPGCISTGETWEEMKEMVREAVPFHIEGMLEHGDPLPEKPMSLEEAMAHYIEPIPEKVMESFAEYGGDVPTLSTTFEIMEFEVNVSILEGAV
jgi:predicted RNase H-like HicB family nuclease